MENSQSILQIKLQSVNDHYYSQDLFTGPPEDVIEDLFFQKEYLEHTNKTKPTPYERIAANDSLFERKFYDSISAKTSSLYGELEDLCQIFDKYKITPLLQSIIESKFELPLFSEKILNVYNQKFLEDEVGQLLFFMTEKVRTNGIENYLKSPL